MGVERANLEVVVGNLAYAHVEVVGIFLSMEACWMGLDIRDWLEWIKEEDGDQRGYFSCKFEMLL